MGGKGYGAVDRLDYFAADWSVDCVYPGSDGGCAQHALLLALRLILIVNRAAQYIVDGGRGLGGRSASVAILSTVGVALDRRTVSQIYILRWPALINISTRNFRLRHRLVSCLWSLW